VISVIVVEDLAPARARFSRVIEAHSDLQLAGTARNLQEGLTLLDQLDPDVVLLDLGLPDGSGVDLIHAIERNQNKTQALVISIYGDESSVVPALEAGAAGYLLKDHPIEDVPQAILQLMDGGAPISPVIARHMLRRFRPAQDQTETGSPIPTDTSEAEEIQELTRREREVLEQVSRGYTSQEIAEKSGKSYHTITTHVRNIYRKLAVNSRAEAVSTAIQKGLLKA